MKTRGADIIAQTLIALGVDTVFGYPGGAVLAIYDALYKYRSKIRHILTSHEQGAAHAADGWARVTGKVGVVIATSGPGATNLVTGIAAAYMDSVPMVAICGNVETWNIGRDSFQEVYIAGITMPVTKHNFVVRSAKELAPTIREAFRIAGEGRQGPVLVDVPKDVASELCEYDPPEPVVYPDPSISETAAALLNKAASMLGGAQCPFMIFGGGVKSSGAGFIVRELSEKADIPYAYTMMGVGVVEPDEKRCMGMIGMHGALSANRAADEADVILAVGTRFSDRVARRPECFAKGAHIIHIDIDGSELGKNVRIDLGIVGDAKVLLSGLLKLLPSRSHTEWNEKLDVYKKSDILPSFGGDLLSPRDIIAGLNDSDNGGTIYTTDVGQHQLWAAKYLYGLTQGAFLTSGGLGAMGYGYGAAIGAAVAEPGHRIVHITGDGSFHMNMIEVATAVTNRLHIISVIFDNGVLGMVRQWQKLSWHEHYQSTTLNRATDYVKVAEGFGAHGFVCRTRAELDDALHAADKLTGPVWIDCKIGSDDMVLPMIPMSGKLDKTVIK